MKAVQAATSVSFRPDIPVHISSEVFDGLRHFYRDANLPPFQFDLYQKGQVIQEPGYMDVSTLEGGMGGVVRYLVLSAFHESFSLSFEEYGAWRMPKGCFFKVVDRIEHQGYLLLILLHVSVTALPYFALSSHPKEAELIRYAHQKMEEWTTTPPHPQLKDAYWLRRTAFPIGLDDDHTFFYRFKILNLASPRKPPGFFSRLFRH